MFRGPESYFRKLENTNRQLMRPRQHYGFSTPMRSELTFTETEYLMRTFELTFDCPVLLTKQTRTVKAEDLAQANEIAQKHLGLFFRNYTLKDVTEDTKRTALGESNKENCQS